MIQTIHKHEGQEWNEIKHKLYEDDNIFNLEIDPNIILLTQFQK